MEHTYIISLCILYFKLISIYYIVTLINPNVLFTLAKFSKKYYIPKFAFGICICSPLLYGGSYFKKIKYIIFLSCNHK